MILPFFILNPFFFLVISVKGAVSQHSDKAVTVLLENLRHIGI